MSARFSIAPWYTPRWPLSALRRSRFRLRYRIGLLQRSQSALMRRILRGMGSSAWRRLLRRIQDAPFSCTYECWGSNCPYNRMRFPERRAAFNRLLQQRVSAAAHSIQVVWYGCGGMLHEMQLLDELMRMSNPLRVVVVLIDEHYHDYIEHRHYYTDRLPADSVGCAACCNRRHSSRSEQLWAHRLNGVMAWFFAQYPQVHWSWYVADSLGTDRYDATDASFCFIIDAELLHEIPSRYTIFQLAHDHVKLEQNRCLRVNIRYFL